jgi:tetratricopeptide (TPR) repeat protein
VEPGAAAGAEPGPPPTRRPKSELLARLEQAPLSAELMAELISLLLDEGALEQAGEYISRCLEVDPGSCRCLAESARFLQLEGRLADALEQIERALRRCPDVAELWIQRSRILLGMGRIAQALAWLEEDYSGPDPHPLTPGLLSQALALQRSGQQGGEGRLRDDAVADPLLEELRHSPRRDPPRLRALLTAAGPGAVAAGIVELVKRDAEWQEPALWATMDLIFASPDDLGAFEPILRFAAEHPDRPAAASLALLVRSYLESERPELGREIRRRRKERPGDLTLIAAEALYLARLDAEEPLDQVVTEWIRRGRGLQFETWRALATLLRAAGAPRQALRLLDALAADDPGNWEIRFQRWIMLGDLRRFKEAEAEAEALQPRWGDEPFFWQMRADHLLKEGSRLDRAVDYYRRCLELEPERTSCLVGLAYTLFTMRRFDDARALYRRCLTADPPPNPESIRWMLLDYELNQGRDPSLQPLFERLGLHPAPAGERIQEAQRVLAADLRVLARALHRAGVPLLVLDYPGREKERDRWLQTTLRAAGKLPGATFVPVSERFREVLRDTPEEALFVLDGHCTGFGYRLIAEEVFDRLESLLAR